MEFTTRDVHSPSVYDDDYNYDAPPAPAVLDPYSDEYYQDLPDLPKKTRPRSPPPTYYDSRRKSPTPEPTILVPSEEYLSLSLQPSQTLTDPASSRKLLILDLNGTLLLRAPHVATRGRGKTRTPHDPYADPTAVRPLRKVYPRPFMPSFREYLFHPKTKKWLDIMVWSSAQPHSVEDMVKRSFLDLKCELIGVWARDTLGLAAADYNRKAQTTKDLAKPWAAIRSLNGQSFLTDQEDDISTNLPTAHSAFTTLLVDDSPLKAQLQPWNHVCVPEYLSKTRATDLRVLKHERTFPEYVLNGERVETDSDPNPHHSKKRRRKLAKKKENKAKRLDDLLAEEDIKYDETLLAVVGVLDALKTEGNVASWIRSGGLWAGVTPSDPVVDESDISSDMELDSDEDRARKVRRLDADADVSSSLPTPTSSAPSSIPAEVQGKWFESIAVLHHWASCGRSALKDLGIPISSGVVD